MTDTAIASRRPAWARASAPEPAGCL